MSTFRILAVLAIPCGLGWFAWVTFNQPELDPALVSPPAQHAVAGSAAPSGGPETLARSEQVAHRFAGLTGMLAGSVASCAPHEKQMIDACGARVLENWQGITTLPTITDPAAQKRISETWKRSEEAGQKYATEQGFPCGELLAKSKQAPIWRVCQRPDALPLDSATRGLRIQ